MRRSLKVAGGIGAVTATGVAFIAWQMRPGHLPSCDAREYDRKMMAAVRALQRPDDPDSVTSASLTAEAKPSGVWDVVEHFESVWPASNPAHVQTCVVTPPETVHEDMIYHDIERVGGITATMYAVNRH